MSNDSTDLQLEAVADLLGDLRARMQNIRDSL